MSARKISKCQKCMCVVLVFTGGEHGRLDTSFTFGNLIRSNHHGLYRFVLNVKQTLRCCSAHTLARLLVKACMCDSVAIFFPSATLPSSLLCPVLPDTTGTVTPYTSTQLTNHTLKTQERPLCLYKTCQFFIILTPFKCALKFHFHFLDKLSASLPFF